MSRRLVSLPFLFIATVFLALGLSLSYTTLGWQDPLEELRRYHGAAHYFLSSGLVALYGEAAVFGILGLLQDRSVRFGSAELPLAMLPVMVVGIPPAIAIVMQGWPLLLILLVQYGTLPIRQSRLARTSP